MKQMWLLQPCDASGISLEMWNMTLHAITTNFASVCLLWWKGRVGSASVHPCIFWIERRTFWKSRSLFWKGFCCSAALPRWVWLPISFLPAAKPECQHGWGTWAQQRVSTSHCSPGSGLVLREGRMHPIFWRGITDHWWLALASSQQERCNKTMWQWCNIRCFAVGQWLDFGSEVRGKKNRVGVLHSGISRGQSAACTVTQQTFPRGTWLSITRPAHPFLANIWVLPVVSSFCSWNSPVCQAPALAPFPQFNLSTHRFLGDDVTYTKQAALCQHLLLHPLWKRNADAVCSWAVSACLHLVHLESYYFSLFGHPFPKDKQKSSTSERHLSASQSDYPALQELHK